MQYKNSGGLTQSEAVPSNPVWVFLDAKATALLPLQMPSAADMRFHGICVETGAEERCLIWRLHAEMVVLPILTLAELGTILSTQSAYRSNVKPDDITIIVDGDFSEDPIFLFEVITPVGSLQLLGEVVIGENNLVIRGAHLWGDPATKWGWEVLRHLGQTIAEKFDVDEIAIYGEVRSTGAGKGRRPRPFRFRRANEPYPRPGG